MPKLVLTYFDFDAGRGEPVRLALTIGGVAFEDRRIAFQDWPKLKGQLPFQAMPVLEVDGKVIAHSNTIVCTRRGASPWMILNGLIPTTSSQSW